MTLEVRCIQTPNGGHEFEYVVLDSEKRVRGVFVNLLDADSFDHYVQAGDVLAAFRGESGLIDTTQLQLDHTFGDGRFDERESQMDSGKRVDPGDDEPDSRHDSKAKSDVGDDDDNGHAAPRIRVDRP